MARYSGSMFTGLIERTGTILSVQEGGGARRIRVQAPGMASRLREGDSIAVSGVCLTALAIADDRFEADLAEETVRRSSLARLAPGSVVNLELPTPAGTPLGGHVVQGHVDGTGAIRSLAPIAAAGGDWWLEVETPENVGRYVVEKGSIAIEGISLTVARWDGRTAGVAIIPHTYAHTNLSTLKAGDPVNLEADVLLKYAENARAAEHSSEGSRLSLAYLLENGY